MTNNQFNNQNKKCLNSAKNAHKGSLAVKICIDNQYIAILILGILAMRRV